MGIALKYWPEAVAIRRKIPGFSSWSRYSPALNSISPLRNNFVLNTELAAKASLK